MIENPFVSTEAPLVIAHQGGERLFPSNTLYAFEQAHNMGVDMFELDIHRSKDGHLVVIHDDTVDRTTDGQGKIAEMDLAEIQGLDAGYYWTEDSTSYPYRAKGIQIPTLAELFEAYPAMPMVIDIKQKESAIEQALCNLLRQYNKTSDIIIGSFHKSALELFRQLCPEVPTSIHPAEVRNMVLYNYSRLDALFRPKANFAFHPKANFAFQPKAIAAQVPMRSGRIQIINSRFIKLARQRNVAVHVWTINDPEEMQQLIDLGVDGIMTDRPDILLELLDR